MHFNYRYRYIALVNFQKSSLTDEDNKLCSQYYYSEKHSADNYALHALSIANL